MQFGSYLTETKDFLATKIRETDNAEKSFLGEKEIKNPEKSFLNVNETQNTDKPYVSTYEERLQQTPKNCELGQWMGERGESTYVSRDPEVQKLLNGAKGIKYKDAIPDFSKVAICKVEIDNMSGSRYQNFKQCDEACAERFNKDGFLEKTDWTPRDVAKFREEKDYTCHECNDMKTCQLIPTLINEKFGHLGGVSECNKCNKTGVIFDE